MIPTARTVRGGGLVIATRRATPMYRRPLVAAALDARGFARLIATAEQALAPDAQEIVVVHAYRIPFAGLHTLTRSTRLAEELRASAHDRLHRLAGSLESTHGRIILVLRHGDPMPVLLAEIAVRGSDLVVVGARRGRSWHRGLPDALLEAAPCDVAVVRGLP